MYDKKMAHEIMAYFRENPCAGDSVEGISRWWLMRERITESVNAVQQALEHLSSVGLVYERRMADGRKVYFAAAHTEATALIESEKFVSELSGADNESKELKCRKAALEH